MERNETSATLSKPEAVWQAIEELGYRAPVSEILEYVRTRFGIDASTPSTPAALAQEQTTPRMSVPPALPTNTATNTPKPASQRKPRPRNESGK